MGEWWTYSVADFIPFVREVYVRMFVRLNESVWPAHIAAVGLGLGVLELARRGWGRPVAAILALSWVWVGWSYHLSLYANLNWAATYFGYASFLQAALLAAAGVLGAFSREPDAPLGAAGWIGLATAAFGTAGFPFLAPLEAQPWRSAEFFGIAPDPTVVATFGLALTGRRIPWWALVIPALWCVVTAATTWVVGGFSGLVPGCCAAVVVAAGLMVDS